jgi:hypothetical protein
MLQDARMAAMRKLHRIVGSRGESPVRAGSVDPSAKGKQAVFLHVIHAATLASQPTEHRNP